MFRLQHIHLCVIQRGLRVPNAPEACYLPNAESNMKEAITSVVPERRCMVSELFGLRRRTIFLPSLYIKTTRNSPIMLITEIATLTYVSMGVDCAKAGSIAMPANKNMIFFIRYFLLICNGWRYSMTSCCQRLSGKHLKQRPFSTVLNWPMYPVPRHLLQYGFARV